MIDLDKQFAELADTSAEDSTCDFVIDEDLRIIAIPERVWCWALREIKTRTASDLE